MDDSFPFDDDVLSAAQYEQGIDDVSDSCEEAIESDQEFQRQQEYQRLLETMGEDV